MKNSKVKTSTKAKKKVNKEDATESIRAGIAAMGSKAKLLPFIQAYVDAAVALGVTHVYEPFVGGGNVACNITGVEKISVSDADAGMISLLQALHTYGTVNVLLEADKILSGYTDKFGENTFQDKRIREIFEELKENNQGILQVAACTLFLIHGSNRNNRKSVFPKQFCAFCKHLKKAVGIITQFGTEEFYKTLVTCSRNSWLAKFRSLYITEKSLKNRNIDISCQDYNTFLSSIAEHGEHNLLLCDPPYTGYKKKHYRIGELINQKEHIEFLAKILTSGDRFVIHFDSAGWDVYALFEMFDNLYTYVLPNDREKKADGFEIVKECIVTNFPVQFEEVGDVSSLGINSSVYQLADYGEAYRENVFRNLDNICSAFRNAHCEALIDKINLERLKRPAR